MNMFTSFGKVTLSVAMAAMTVLSASAQEKVINGYFRVQSAAGVASQDQYVEVRGPFTAAPDMTFQAAQKSAGSVIYISAEAEGEGADVSYRLTNLRSQGIDVSLDNVAVADYENFINDVLAQNVPLVYGMVQLGFQRGYTSIARTTVGAIIHFAAAELDNRRQDDAWWNTADHKQFLEEHPDFDRNGDYLAVAREFNETVTANLDIAIRLRPVPGKERTYTITFDVPSFESVSQWYATSPKKAEFEAAMDIMSLFLADHGLPLENFTAKDSEILKGWGYDLASNPGNKVITAEESAEYAGYVQSSFRTIFADHNLLFNWLKLLAYKVTRGSSEFPELGTAFDGVGDMMKGHYITSLMYQYLPYIQQGQRASLINGEGNTFNFAGSSIDTLGDKGQWVIQPVDNESQEFFVDVEHSWDGSYHTACMFDFPVEAEDDATKFYTLSEMKTKLVDSNSGKELSYVEMTELTGTVPAQTPFILATEYADGQVKLVIPGDIKYPDPIEARPENSFVVSDEEVSTQRVIRRAADENSSTGLKGVLLPTAIDTDALSNLWGINYDQNQPLHRLGTTERYEVSEDGSSRDQVTRLSLNNATSGTLKANEAVYLPGENTEENLVLIGEPKDETPLPTGVENITVEAEGETVIYDLRGVRVTAPKAGNIYIINGKKALLM